MSTRKIIFTITSILCIMFFSSVCYATDMKDKADSAKDHVENAMKDTKDNMKEKMDSSKNHVKNFADDTGKNMKNFAGSVDNKMKDRGRNDAYKTERTEAEVTGVSSNTWTWIIIGVAGIAIMAVVWYYFMQPAPTEVHKEKMD